MGMCQLSWASWRMPWLPFSVRSPLAPTKSKGRHHAQQPQPDLQGAGGLRHGVTLPGQSLAIRRDIGDKAGEGTTLNNLSQISDARGDYDTALRYLEQSLAIRREIGDKAEQPQRFQARGDYDTALRYLEQSLAISAHGKRGTTRGTRHDALAGSTNEPAFSDGQGDAERPGIFHTARTLGQVLASAGQQNRHGSCSNWRSTLARAPVFPRCRRLKPQLRRLPSTEERGRPG